MSQFINITGSRESSDPTFRYKMPRMVARTEGRGNGIRTLIANMREISESLNRPPDLVTKFFGVELGAQSRWEAELEKSTVNGAHNTQDMQKMLNIFIDRYVLCPKCHLPETALAIKKGMIYHKCSACGSKELVDLSHKLCVYILKQAELAAAAAKEESEKKEKKEKKDKKEKSEKKEKKEKKAADKAKEDDSDDEGKLAVAEEQSSEEEASPLSPAAAVAASRATVLASKLEPLRLAVEAVLAAGKDEAVRGAAVKRVAETVKTIGAKQIDLVLALQSACGASTAAEADRPLLKAVPLALEALYDADVLAEETIFAWHKGVEGDAAVKAKAKPFIEWLANADEEEEGED